MSTIKVDTIATRTGSGNITVSNNIAGSGTISGTNLTASGTLGVTGLITASAGVAIGGTGTFITLLSLIVGGIGVMNIMFVSVKERTREIGVRKAIGATKGMIMSQFLMEAVTICLLAGLIGLLFAYLGSFLLNKIFPSNLDLSLALFSILISMFVGVISGIIPSYRAAKLDPIDSLRYE